MSPMTILLSIRELSDTFEPCYARAPADLPYAHTTNGQRRLVFEDIP